MFAAPSLLQPTVMKFASRILSSSITVLALSVAALGGSPRLTHVNPGAGPRGGEIELELKGNNLADARELLFDTPGFTVTELKAPDEKEKNRLKAKVQIAPDVRLGEHTFRVITNSGISDIRLLYVTPFPVVAEAAEDKDVPDKPQPVSLGTTVFGRVQNEDVDRYEVEAKKGQRISVEVIGARLQTQQVFDTAIRITKADGTSLAEADDGAFTRQDPVSSIVAPEDGKYLVSIKDSTNSGQGECAYVMNIGTFPRPLAVYPAGGKTGEETKFTLIGDATGPIQRTVKLPDQPEERFELFTEDGQPAPQPNFIRVSNFGNVLEAEPNNDVNTPTLVPGEAPIALNGIIEQKGDVDCFKFTAKKGVDYDINVFARKLRSPLDSIIDIYNLKGARLNGNDDAGNVDSYVRWKAPEDGEYVLAVRDQLFRGGPTFTYRVEINTVVKKVTAWLPEMVINSSQERRAIPVPKGNRYATMVRVKRIDEGGDLNLNPEGLPEGVSVTGTFMDKSVDTVAMVFEATPEAAPVAKAINIAAKFTEPEKANVESRIEHDVDVAENGNQRSYYQVKEHSLPIAVTEEVPVKIELIQPKVPILQNGSMNLKVRAERKGDFKGAVSLSLLWAPPGIGSPGTVPIKEGENEGSLQISANGNAQIAKWKICVVGSVDYGKGPVFISTQLIDLEVAAPFIAGTFARTFVDQGDQGSITLKLEQKVPFEGKAKVAVVSLPNGVTAEPREITKDDTEVKFELKAAADAQVGQHKQLIAQFTLEKDGEPMTNSVAKGGILRVDKASVAKK
jgi:hypothetical protein